MFSTKLFNKGFEGGFVRKTQSFPLKTEQNRNTLVPSPHQQAFFVLLFFIPKCVEKYIRVYDICIQSLPFFGWLYEIVC